MDLTGLRGATEGCSQAGRFLSLLVLLTLIVHPISFFCGFDTRINVYSTFACYSFLVVFSVVNRAWFLAKSEVAILCLAVLGCLFGAMLGLWRFGAAGLGSAVGFLLGMLSVLSFSSCLCRADVLLLFRVIAIFGVLAAAYAFIFQSERWIGVLMGNEVGFHSWRYVSFFGQRNRFAACMYFAVICCGALYCATARKIYIAGAGFLLVQILCTNSRTAMVAAGVAVVMLVYSKSKYRILTSLILIVTALVCGALFFDEILVSFSSFFNHYGGFDSASSRIDMWKFGIGSAVTEGGFVFGFGTGTQSDVLPPLYEVASFHSMYVELFFEGGIVKVIIYIIVIITAVLFAKRNRALHDAGLWKGFYLPLVASWLIFSMFESGATPFSTTLFSLVASVLVLVVPRCFSEEMPIPVCRRSRLRASKPQWRKVDAVDLGVSR